MPYIINEDVEIVQAITQPLNDALLVDGDIAFLVTWCNIFCQITNYFCFILKKGVNNG